MLQVTLLSGSYLASCKLLLILRKDTWDIHIGSCGAAKARFEAGP